MVWHDEFDGTVGSAVNPRFWTPEIGGSGWGNKELEFYSNSTSNAHIDGDGSLLITALPVLPTEEFKCWYGPCQFTSARLTTKNKFAQAFGRFEARIRIPRGQGVWPAFWLLGDNIDRVGWPACGEIDIMENIGREPGLAHGTIHGPGYSGEKGLGASVAVPAGQQVSDKYHIFAVEWEPSAIRFYMDDRLYETRTPSDIPAGARWAYDHPFFIILNLAIGGSWPGGPDEHTVFPQSMSVDYVRVYKRGR